MSEHIASLLAMSAKKKLNHTAENLLLIIVTTSRERRNALHIEELAAGDSATRSRAINALWVLKQRWLITVDGSKVRPRQTGVAYLRKEGLLSA